MASKNTKAIQHRCTKKASSVTDHVSCTDVHSPALKNTFPSKEKIYWAHQRGLDSEKYVIHFYEDQEFELLAQRLKTPFAEVDLLFRTPQGHVLMVEVKTVNLADFHLYRISHKQKRRLLRAVQYLTEKLESLVEVHWAFVTKDGEVTVIEDISG